MYAMVSVTMLYTISIILHIQLGIRLLLLISERTKFDVPNPLTFPQMQRCRRCLQFSVALCIRGNSTQSVDTTFKKIFQNIVLKPGPLVQAPIIGYQYCCCKQRKYYEMKSSPNLGLLTKSKVDERLYMFARRHSNRLSSTLEQRLRISSTLMVHFFSIRRVHHEKIG